VWCRKSAIRPITTDTIGKTPLFKYTVEKSDTHFTSDSAKIQLKLCSKLQQRVRKTSISGPGSLWAFFGDLTFSAQSESSSSFNISSDSN